MHDLWVEKYRPDTLDGYVFKDADMKEQIHSWVNNRENRDIPFPNLLLSGAPGSGKTTISSILCNIFDVNKDDILTINASRDNNVETVRNRILGFCTTFPIGKFKVVRLEECDHLSINAQAILRSEIERFSNGVRFILTCNYPTKIIPALRSRLQTYHFDTLDLEGYFTRMIEILDAEKVEYNPEYLEAFIDTAFPDLRKGINLLDQHTWDGKLHPLKEHSESKDYLLDMANLFKKKDFKKARQLICSQASPEEYEEIYRYFYQNVEIFGETDEQQTQAIIEISNGVYRHAIVADPEINLAATLCKLASIAE